MTVAVPRRARWPFEVVHLFRDVTHRRHTEEFARRAGSALRELLSEEIETRQQEEAPRVPPPPPLSRRELEVLRLLAAGLGTREIADSLAVQPITARNHITRVLNKLGVDSRLQAVVYASQHGLI
ncbi:MAG: response regulator transcription factor [Chloroflexi bacterium]|nr:response regulator transcription factor [Chloroflexota bacterium]